MSDKFITYNEAHPTQTGLPAVVDAKLTDRYATKAELQSAIIGTGGVTSPSVNRILASDDPDTPLSEGDLLLVYASPLKIFTNFDTLDGWSPMWADGGWAVKDDPEALDGRVATASLDGRRLLSADAVLGDPESADVEIISRFWIGDLAGGLAAALFARASGDIGAETGYAAALSAGKLNFSRFSAGTFLAAGETAADTSPGWKWMRFRCVGDTLSASVWNDGDPEPSQWMLTRTATAITGGGTAGISPLSTAGSVQAWDCVGIALGGGTAPMEAV